MLDYIRENLMVRMVKQVQIMKIIKDTIYLRIRKKLERIINKTRHCIIKPIAGKRFQVSMFRDQFTVNLMAHVCSCR